MSTRRSQYQDEYQPYEPFSVTLKAGRDFDSPWIIVKADSAAELKERLNELEEVYALQTVARLSQSLSEVYEHEKNKAR